MVAFTKDVCIRKTRLFGTQGEIEGDGNIIKLFKFSEKDKGIIEFNPETDEKPNSKLTGHSYGDYYLVKAFMEAVQSGDQSKIKCNPEEAVESHLIVFAAEKARKENTVINL